MNPYFKTLRPHHWIKNSLILLPCVAGAHFSRLDSFFPLLLGIVSFCLASSFGYITNDINDVESDRLHVRKKHRPIAAGTVSKRHAFLLAVVLLFSSLALASLIHWHYLCLIASYISLTQLYTKFIKRIALLDLVCLSGLYSMRVIAGLILTPAEATGWLFAFSLALFFSLASLKRFTEVKDSIAGKQNKLSGRGYSVQDGSMLQVLGIASGFLATATLIVYAMNSAIAEGYSSPKFLFIIPAVLTYWLNTAWIKAQRGRMHSDPIVYAIKDKSSYLALFLCVLAVVIARLF